jgi:hypothetical protein
VAGLAVALGLVVAGGSAAGYAADRHLAGLEQETTLLREGQQALAKERERAKAAELGALDRRFSALVLRARSSTGAAEQLAATEAARNALDPKALDHDRLRAFGDALDALSARLDTVERVSALDRRRDDLVAWAAERRRSEATAAARFAGARARAAFTEESIGAYERSLDQLRGALAQAGTAAGGQGLGQKDDHDHDHGTSCLRGDPGCGLDGKPIF